MWAIFRSIKQENFHDNDIRDLYFGGFEDKTIAEKAISDVKDGLVIEFKLGLGVEIGQGPGYVYISKLFLGRLFTIRYDLCETSPEYLEMIRG